MILPKLSRTVILIFIALLTSGTDYATKRLIVNEMKLGDINTVIPGFFNLTYVLNKGVAFGMLSDSAEIVTSYILLFVTTVIALVILHLALYKVESQIETVYYSFILGGAAGNIIDRFSTGAVVDWLSFHFKNKYFYPTFNLADSFIVIGVSLLFINELKNKPIRRRTLT